MQGTIWSITFPIAPVRTMVFHHSYLDRKVFAVTNGYAELDRLEFGQLLRKTLRETPQFVIRKRILKGLNEREATNAVDG